jgi:hypothetical protein
MAIRRYLHGTALLTCTIKGTENSFFSRALRILNSILRGYQALKQTYNSENRHRPTLDVCYWIKRNFRVVQSRVTLDSRRKHHALESS